MMFEISKSLVRTRAQIEMQCTTVMSVVVIIVLVLAGWYWQARRRNTLHLLKVALLAWRTRVYCARTLRSIAVICNCEQQGRQLNAVTPDKHETGFFLHKT
jgi:fumarate reductase subunit D